jgi:hypothetical protein
VADYINNVAAGDQYTPACTIGPNFSCNNVVLTIANNAALMQFAVGAEGNWRWTDEREFLSIPQSFRVGNVVGVRVRNAQAGQVARVLAVLAGGDGDPDFQSGQPFVGILTPSGTIVPANVVTGIVEADGSINSGTTFTAVQNATGDYSVTFKTPFAALPVILLTTFSPTGTIINIAGGNGTFFRVFIWALSGGVYVPTNTRFAFSAQAAT